MALILKLCCPLPVTFPTPVPMPLSTLPCFAAVCTTSTFAARFHFRFSVIVSSAGALSKRNERFCGRRSDRGFLCPFCILLRTSLRLATFCCLLLLQRQRGAARGRGHTVHTALKPTYACWQVKHSWPFEKNTTATTINYVIERCSNNAPDNGFAAITHRQRQANRQTIDKSGTCLFTFNSTWAAPDSS